MSTNAQKNAQKKYNKKRVVISTTYRESEKKESDRLKEYLDKNGLSANAYIKELIQRDLDEKGVEYPGVSEKELES